MNTLLISRKYLFIILITIITLPVFCQETKKAEGDDITFDLTETTSEQKQQANEGGNLVPIWDFVRMLLVLGLVIVVIYFFFFFLKKGIKKKHPESDLIKVIAQVPLQGNESLFLIQTGFHYFLVGSGGGSLSLISEITDKETIDTIRLKASSEGIEPAKQNFSDILANLFHPGKKGESVSLNPISFMKKQQERLNKLK